MHRACFVAGKFKQQGSTLVISMMVLILIMMMGITALVTSDTQFKLAGNLQFEDTATNNAEAAIAAAEFFLSDKSKCPFTGFDSYAPATAEQYPIGTAVSPLDMTWTDGSNSKMVNDSSQMYYIQKISKNVVLDSSGLGVGGRRSAPPNVADTYLITARGTSARGSVKFIQSYFRVPLPC
ncbi:MAG: hypothetical protein HXX19_12455 [Rhodoferax sp.]|nr:hypothetical protein [Rhodoferax sp.]